MMQAGHYCAEVATMAIEIVVADAGDVSSDKDRDNKRQEQQECDSEGEPFIYICSTVEYAGAIDFVK